MVDAVEVKNFRGFEHLKAKGFGQINCIVGDNAVGKTAFLEAIWLTLVRTPEKAFNIRQWRGLDLKFSANSDAIAEELYGDLYHNATSDEPATIELWGNGAENRLLRIEKTRGTFHVPLMPIDARAHEVEAKDAELARVPIEFVFRDENGVEHRSFMTLEKDGMSIQQTSEVNLPECHLFPAQMPVPSAQSADYYSSLVKHKRAHEFRDLFLSIFNWVEDIQVDSQSRVLLGEVPWANQLLPLPLLSGGISRVAAILLSMARRQTSIVLVDEIESGIFHRRQKKVAQALIQFANHYETQLFMTSHSEEWLKNLADASANGRSKNVAFWRMERDRNGSPKMRRFTVEEFQSGLEMGEMR